MSYQNSEPGQYVLSNRPAEPRMSRRQQQFQEPESDCDMECCCCQSSQNFNRLVEDTDSVRRVKAEGCCLRCCLCFCCCFEDFINGLKVTLLRSEKRNDDLEAKLLGNENKVKELRDTLAKKEAENHDLTLRVSKLASERMREGNACVEDLSDSLRPSAITDKWSGLFRSGEYWTTFEYIVHTGKSEAETAELLYQVCQVVYETCVEMVEKLIPTVVTSQPKAGQGPAGLTPSQWQIQDRPELQKNLEELLPENKSDVEAFLQRFSDDVDIVQRKLRRSMVEFLRAWKQLPLVQERVVQAIHTRVTGIEDKSLVKNFAAELTPLCFAMRLHDIPVAVSFRFDAGSPLNTSFFEVEGSPDSGLEPRVVRPPLLREAGGAVLLKGELQYMKPAPPQPGEDQARGDPPKRNRGQRLQNADLEGSETT